MAFSVEEAQQAVLVHFAPLATESVHLLKALGRTLAASVHTYNKLITNSLPTIEAQTMVTTDIVGVLAGLGAMELTVYRRPKVAILATGGELVDIGVQPGQGQIRNVNGYANAAQVSAAGGEVLQLPIARDTPEAVREQLHAGKAWGADLFLSSGGVSVGDYDVIKKVLGEWGSLDFWKVDMQPGRPVAFGRVLDVPWLGLPGNPVAAMITFELFGRPALLKMSGRRGLFRATVPAVITERITNPGDRRRYFRTRITQRHGEWYAHLTGDQSTGILTSMLHADGLLIVPAAMPVIEAGTRLQVMVLD